MLTEASRRAVHRAQELSGRRVDVGGAVDSDLTAMRRLVHDAQKVTCYRPRDRSVPSRLVR